MLCIEAWRRCRAIALTRAGGTRGLGRWRTSQSLELGQRQCTDAAVDPKGPWQGAYRTHFLQPRLPRNLAATTSSLESLVLTAQLPESLQGFVSFTNGT